MYIHIYIHIYIYNANSYKVPLAVTLYSSYSSGTRALTFEKLCELQGSDSEKYLSQ